MLKASPHILVPAGLAPNKLKDAEVYVRGFALRRRFRARNLMLRLTLLYCSPTHMYMYCTCVGSWELGGGERGASYVGEIYVLHNPGKYKSRGVFPNASKHHHHHSLSPPTDAPALHATSL